MLVILNNALGYNGDVLERGAVVELPHDFAQNLIRQGNGEEYIVDTLLGDDDNQSDNGAPSTTSGDGVPQKPPGIALGRSAKIPPAKKPKK